MRFFALTATFLTVVLCSTSNAALDPGEDGPNPGESVFSPPEAVHDLFKRQQYTDLNYTGPVYQAYNFSMPIDHFNTSDNRTYQNRYWINDTYYESGGPVIWHDYGEAGVTNSSIWRWLGEANGTTAAMALARQYHGLVVLWELRYFGYSLPFPLNVSDSTTFREPVGAPAAWKYDSLEQGLEDAAFFANHFDQGSYQRENMTALLPQNTPWIFLGGSYPGVRAANVRARNPEVFYASWSSSAPVQAMYDGSILYSGPEMSLYSNCSRDVKAIVRYADEIFAGAHGPDAFSHLQRLSYASNAFVLSNYNISQATSLQPIDIAQRMATPFGGTFFSAGPTNTTWLFCNALATYNANATGSNTNDTYLSIVTNPGNALPSDDGFLAAHNDNLTLGLEAYHYAYTAYSNFMVPYLAEQRSRVHLIPDGRADGAAWDYIVNTQFGYYSGSNPNNISIVSTLNNVTYNRRTRFDFSFGNTTKASFPDRPDTASFNRLGGWRMNPSHVMFTSGALDPWRAGSVFSLETEIGAPGLQPSAEIPACGASPNDPSQRFGIVYPDAVHVPDLSAMEEVYGTGPDTPFARGLALFTKALDVWLPCFGNSTSNRTARHSSRQK